MLENILVVAEQVGVLFLLMAVGFVLGKLGLVDTHTSGQMSTLLLYAVTPCVVVSALQTERTAALVTSLLWCGAFLVAQYTVLIFISQLTFRKTSPETRSVLRFGQVYSNNSFMGLPLVQAALGTEASVFVVPSLVAFQIFQWTHGVLIMGGKTSVKRMVLSPGVMGIAVGFFLFFNQITLPSMLATTVDLLAGMNTPLAMVIIGTQMARADLKAVFTSPRLYGVSAVKLLVSPLVTMAVMLPFLPRLDPTQFCALVILSAAPVAGATSIFAQRYERDTACAAQAVSLSTLLSMVTLSAFAALAKSIAF